MLISERQRISAFLLKILLRDVHRVVCLQMDLFQFWLVAAMFVRINTKCSQNYTNKIVFCYYEFFRQYNVNHKISITLQEMGLYYLTVLCLCIAIFIVALF